MNARDLERLIFNPLYTSSLLRHFITGFQLKNSIGVKLELIYLVLPILYNDQLSSKLVSLNKMSRLNTFLENSKDYSYMFNELNERIPEYRALTNQSLLVLTKTAKLNIAPFLTCEKVDFHEEQNQQLRTTFKAAFNLGQVFAKESYHSIFLRFKITNL